MTRALVDKFYASFKQVRAANPQALMIDLTQNGGGKDWVRQITALLTKKTLVCGRRGFIKHPHYVKIFTEKLNALKSAPNKEPPKIKENEEKLKMAAESCDRTPIWTRKDFKLACSAVAYTSGGRCADSEMKFKGKRKYDGKLFFLVDERTASAAEEIVARHADNKTAVVIGAHTHGSGCGFMNGGISFTLPQSGLSVTVPDCIRERVDGTNEVVGIEPDLKMEMSERESPEFLSHLTEQVVSLLNHVK